MNRLFKLGMALTFLTVPLSGCVSLGEAFSVIGAAQTVYSQVTTYYKGAPKAVFALRGGYDIALGAAATFKTTFCPKVTSHAYCPKIIPLLRSANHRALTALDTAENFVRQNPTLDPSSLITAAQTAIKAFAKVETDNGVPAK